MSCTPSAAGPAGAHVVRATVRLAPSQGRLLLVPGFRPAPGAWVGSATLHQGLRAVSINRHCCSPFACSSCHVIKDPAVARSWPPQPNRPLLPHTAGGPSGGGAAALRPPKIQRRGRQRALLRLPQAPQRRCEESCPPCMLPALRQARRRCASHLCCVSLPWPAPAQGTRHTSLKQR